MAASTKRSINQHSAHIYDDVSDLTRHSSSRGIRKSVTNRISHNYERLIGIAKDKKNRMCIFGVVATVVAIFSITGAVLFSMFYARPTFCGNATVNWINVCRLGRNRQSHIICTETTKIAIHQVVINRHNYTKQAITPCSIDNFSCIDSNFNMTEAVQNRCADKVLCMFDDEYFIQLYQTSKEYCPNGYSMFEIRFSCI